MNILDENKDFFSIYFSYEIKKTETITFQRAAYIEDGLYIVKDKEFFSLYEIPEGGGEPDLLGFSEDINELIKIAKDVK